MKALVLTQLPLMLSWKRKEKNANGLFEVYLYDTTNDKDLFLNQVFVDEDLATSKVFSKKSEFVFLCLLVVCKVEFAATLKLLTMRMCRMCRNKDFV